MKSLWLKDRPWILTFAIVGAMALALVTSDNGFLRLFVLGPHRLDNLFFCAGGTALVLGGVAVLWDDILGTREFLMQRPISRRSLFRSRMLASVAVLASWMVAIPLLTWLLAAWSIGIYDLSFWAGVPEILSTLQIVWPMCAIGFLAAAMPAPWWQRLVCATLLTVTVGMAIDRGTANPGGEVSPAWFAVACWLPAIVLFSLAAGLDAQRQDPDRPWSHRTRWLAGSALVVSLAYMVGGVARDAQTHSARSLLWEYPRIVRIDGAIRLASRSRDWNKLTVADENHVTIGEVRDSDDFARIEYDSQRIPELLQIEAPRFHRRRGLEARIPGGRVWIGHDGSAWLLDVERREVRRSGIGPDLAKFPDGLRPQNVDDVGEQLNRSVVVVGDQESGKLWRFDGKLGYFVAWPLPDGDRFEDVPYLRLVEWRNATGEAPALLLELLTRHDQVSHLRGANASYLIKDGELVAVDVPRRNRGKRERLEGVRHGNDPLVFSVEVPAHDDLPSFRHDFAPRTWAELGYAANAMALAAMRPPVTQVVSHLFTDDRSADAIWSDRVICGGKRTWLVLSGIALSVICALLMRRRLRRIGVTASACRFWVVATIVAGPVTAILPLFLESARNHAHPDVKAPPAPRIVSVRNPEEIRA